MGRIALYPREELEVGVVRAFGRFVVATAAGAGLGAGAALYRRHVLEQGSADEDAPATPEAVATEPAPEAAHAAAAPSSEPAPATVDIEALQASIADLEAARTRLRERAAALRAEMEGADR